MKSLNDNFYKQIDRITQLSKKVNKNNKEKIFNMIKEHSIEIEELYNENNKHWAVETADLIVLCFELLILENIDINSNFNKCFPRFFKKLEET